MPWIDVAAATTAARPTDGRGANTTTAVSTFTAATIFVPAAGAVTAGAWPSGSFVASANTNTIDGAWGGGGATPAVGGIIIDNQGGAFPAWGVITAITADMVAVGGTTYDVIQVDRWRKPGIPGSSTLPTAGDDLGYFATNYCRNLERWIIDSIEVKTPAAVNVSINDLNGTALKTLTCAAGNPFVFPTNWGGPLKEGETGWEINQPFSVTTGAGLAVTVNFRVISGT